MGVTPSFSNRGQICIQRLLTFVSYILKVLEDLVIRRIEGAYLQQR